MDKPVTKVIKSKSSNSAVYTKTDKNNKKSRSNAEFQPNVLKKRGMYVEKKDTRTAINDPENSQPKQKAPPRPRPGSKRFLTSVLTILSKSTTGTQHPDLNDPKSSKCKNNSEAQMKRMKRKYKSKVLNEKPDEKLIVLQSTKDIINTPSLYSERSQDTLKNNTKLNIQKIDKGVDVDVKTLQKKDKKVTIDDPATLVEDKKDPALYNFFVDLLQTTFSACDMKDQSVLKKPCESKLELVINESVAKKLNVINDVDNRASKTSNLCCLMDDTWSDMTVIQRSPSPLEYSKIDLPKQRCTRPRRIESFNNKVMLPKMYSGLFPSKKSYTAKNKKKIVLSLLKRQLKMDADILAEPQNMYQALKNIARNKRKHQKSIRFVEDSGDECIFKQRKVISTGKSKRIIERRAAKPNFYYAKRHVKQCPSDESLHSIEVYDYDYEVDQKRRKDKKIFYARPSFTSISEINRINDDIISVAAFY